MNPDSALRGSHPILTCAAAGELEQRLFAGDETREWSAMGGAGRAVAGAVVEDFREIGGFPATARILVLAGKGHNGGDALLAAQVLLERFPGAVADVVLVVLDGSQPLQDEDRAVLEETSELRRLVVLRCCGRIMSRRWIW